MRLCRKERVGVVVCVHREWPFSVLQIAPPHFQVHVPLPKAHVHVWASCVLQVTASWIQRPPASPPDSRIALTAMPDASATTSKGLCMSGETNTGALQVPASEHQMQLAVAAPSAIALLDQVSKGSSQHRVPFDKTDGNNWLIPKKDCTSFTVEGSGQACTRATLAGSTEQPWRETIV